MPLNLSQLIANRASVSVDFGGGNLLNVEYMPATITGETLSSITRAGNPGQLTDAEALTALDGVTAILAQLLASWDLVDDAGAVLAISEDNLKALGLMNQWTILNAVLAAQGTTGKSSAPTANGTLSK